MSQTMKGATLTVTVRVRKAAADRREQVTVLCDPPLTNSARQRLVGAIDPAYLFDIPDGNYVIERSVRGGCRVLRAPRGAEAEASRILNDLLLPTNDLLTALIQTIRDIPGSEAAARTLAEAYRFICARLIDAGEVTRIRPGFVEWHFDVKAKVGGAVDRAIEKQEPHVHVTLRDAKRDLVMVERAGKVHAYLEVTGDACPFQVMHSTEASQVMRRLAPDVEARTVLKLLRRLAEEAHQRWHASEQIRNAFRFSEQAAPEPKRADGPIMQGGEPGDA